jgi:hypothetical protein
VSLTVLPWLENPSRTTSIDFFLFPQGDHQFQIASNQLRVSRLQTETTVLPMVPAERYPETKLDAEAFSDAAGCGGAVPRDRVERSAVVGKTTTMCLTSPIVEEFVAGKPTNLFILIHFKLSCLYFQERHTRLAIVLIQKSGALPPGDDLLASERAAALTSVCDINAKMLFILPHNDHLMGYVSRLESAFLELAQSYYAQLTKIIRSHRDQLTAEHLTLIIRHQFKLGFISEMRLDHSTALK